MSVSGTDSRWVLPAPKTPAVPVAGIEARFPVHRIYCVGQNYAEHVREMGGASGRPPLFFAKPADAVTTRPSVPWPPMTEELHHEVELVVALERGGKDLGAEQALESVYGYAVGVDLTRRDLQVEAKARRGAWTVAKGFDYSAPISPIRRLAEGGHPVAAGIRLAVNGLLRQQGTTAQMIWPVGELLAQLSRYFELQPGDLVFTGTPAGVGPLQPGDTVGCAIDGVGSLAFVMETPSSPASGAARVRVSG